MSASSGDDRPAASAGTIQLTRLSSSSGTLTKRISLRADGGLNSDGSACVMSRGTAYRETVESPDDFADLIGGLESNEAIALGSLRPDLPDVVEISTVSQLAKANGSAPPSAISRTAGNISYRSECAAAVLIDHDTKGMPPAVADRLKAHGGFWPALLLVAPELEGAARVERRSTSSGISRADTGELIKGSNGVHIFVFPQDGADAERFLKTLHDRCWLRGLGWMMVGTGGQLLERSIVDRMVYAPERLVFEGAPLLLAPLKQDTGLRTPVATDGVLIDTLAACRPLTVVERAQVEDLKAAERHRLNGAAAASKATFMREHIARLVARGGASTLAQRTVERQCGGVLLPAIELSFDAEEMAGATVADVLTNPEKFVGETLADPLEGIEYGRCKAKVMQRPDGTLWINSFAHGRIAYELKHDAGSVEAAIEAADPAEAADVFVRMLRAADLEEDEDQKLRAVVMERAGVKPRPLAAKIKAANTEQHKQRTAERADRAAATRVGRRDRLRLPAPLADDERLPVLRGLDEVLSAVDADEPPMRDLEGKCVEVRSRPPLLLHELTSSGSNQDEPENSRLPPPELPLLTRHDAYTMAHTVEQHIEYVQAAGPKAGRPVALPPVFIDHYMAYRDSVLPCVGAVVTAPLVLTDGTLLAQTGLDRARRMVFRIEPRLIDLLPDAEHRTEEGTALALDYLAHHWLCDVAADFAGKCVLIALALTIIERVLLPERPAFFITAGKRGGGKTTAIMMVVLAVTGKKPPAAAWSSSEEERRKSILAYLVDGMAALVWDNIPTGSQIASPSIEKVLSAESFSDRLLGGNNQKVVPCFTVLTFTGNNIGPKGDLASRSLITRLEVDRPDPENRRFTHGDPVAWTLEHRGNILSALYTLLLGNRQLKQARDQVHATRFKTWWRLVGSAIENAAEALEQFQHNNPAGPQTASRVDFNELFADAEAEDEETVVLSDVLEAFDRLWPGSRTFQASDVAGFVNNPPLEGNGIVSAIDREDADMLRSFFDTNGRGGQITSKAIGHRLGTVKDAPVFVGDRTMKLVRNRVPVGGKQNASATFRVRTL